MHKLVIDTETIKNCIGRDDPWMCIYYRYQDIFQSSIGKMMDMNASQIFTHAKSGNFEHILRTLREFKSRKEEIERILNKAENMCPIEEDFSVYILPAPFDWVITQYSPEIGLFILFTRGEGNMIKFSNFPVYLPHEYAHVVRLHSVLLPRGISSPYQMSFASLAIFEGLGVLFSAYFNGDLKKENIWKYIPIEREKWEIYIKKDKEYMEIFKMQGNEILTKDKIQHLYGPERIGYVMGSLMVFSLVKKGYSLCELDKMKDEEITKIIFE